MKPLRERTIPPFDPHIHFIDGEKERGEGERLPVTFPVTGEPLLEAAVTSETQLDRALGAARRSFDRGGWRGKSPSERGRVLEAMADQLLSRRDDLVTRILFDNGKTSPEATGDVLAAAAALRASAEACRAAATPAPPQEQGVVKLIWREPVGVVAALTPFNAPLLFAALKAGPALAAGNSVVLKPSERAPLLPIALCEAASAAGLPPGTLNLVHGGPVIAARLCRDPRVDMISLTGGTRSGAAVMEAAAATIKNLLLELGGKSAHILLADCDLDEALPVVLGSIFRNAGQRCFSGSRLVVEESIADEVEGAVARSADGLRVGDPFEPSTEVGAMIDGAAVERVEAFLSRALPEGLTLAAGGKRVRELEPGSFFRPTVLTGAASHSIAAQEEIFGPVLTVIRVKDAEEAVRVANDSRYGLAGGVWTGNLDRALDLARRIRCGTFWINTYGAIFGDVPFGGVGQSGLGREAGIWGYESYTELKSVLIDRTRGTTAPRFPLK